MGQIILIFPQHLCDSAGDGGWTVACYVRQMAYSPVAVSLKGEADLVKHSEQNNKDFAQAH
jgi:hypothetical protein